MLKRLEIAGFKSFARKTVLDFSDATTAIVGPNGSGKSNVAEAFRFALGEQSMKSMRGKRSEDLIFAGSHESGRANRAGVAIVFDNTRRIFPKIDFDEVTIERAVYRSGESEYSVNGSKVRLRDVQELLASANIGESGHHIISQGEADRILLAHPRERRAMLEDALGLKVYEFRKQEAQRKLEKTEENVREVEGLRREIAPHIKFLKKQVERLERAQELMTELADACREYFAVEDVYLAQEKKTAQEKRDASAAALAEAEAELKAFDERTTHDTEGLKHAQKIRDAERELDRALGERSKLARELGRVEGSLEGAKRATIEIAQEKSVKIGSEELRVLREEIDRHAELPEDAPAPAVHAALRGLVTMLKHFLERYLAPNTDYLAREEQAVYKLEAEQKELLAKDAELTGIVDTQRSQLLKARADSLAYNETGQEQRHRLIEVAQKRGNLEAEVEKLDAYLRELTRRTHELSQSKHEALALAGSPAVTYTPLAAIPEGEATQQEDRKRVIERLKIRVEEAGGTGEDVKREYEEASAREEFLARELEDLSKSAAGLHALITDLDGELHKSFTEGLAKVNTSFGEFFSLMFGGGGAKLVQEELAEPDEEDEYGEDEEESVKSAQTKKAGIEISVNLPKKRVQSLMQLSGGERALTSIALIFAMSQVNPPPFLILDETDAALDEANSRRYGDMIEALAKRSQLIVISHNRETMSRAGILYGVTMGGDGISKLLSIKFEQAAQVAK